MQMTSYSHHNLISMRKTFPEILVKIRRDDVMLRHMTSRDVIMSDFYHFYQFLIDIKLWYKFEVICTI